LRTVANGNYIGMAIDFGFRVREGIEKKSCEGKTRKTAWDRTAKYSCTNWVGASKPISATARPPGVLVRALGKQRHQHHQIRQAKQPLVSVCAGSFRGARDESQMAALGEVMDMIDANPG